MESIYSVQHDAESLRRLHSDNSASVSPGASPDMCHETSDSEDGCIKESKAGAPNGNVAQMLLARDQKGNAKSTSTPVSPHPTPKRPTMEPHRNSFPTEREAAKNVHDFHLRSLPHLHKPSPDSPFFLEKVQPVDAFRLSPALNNNDNLVQNYLGDMLTQPRSPAPYGFSPRNRNKVL
ncbi:hypothetical protein BZG36_04177 [Bifiguratus adelaidae]|uniref:Uncharacterized protein n=1 Tax=Bifiguratus adelaidae TaxID=1938954 RepID=A0A261XYT7_9FUNG|nr:hypothetical protein BZG36_04177 [Bifiguratus adelaidae]